MNYNGFFLFFILQIKNRFKSHNISAFSAQIAYFFLLSFFPFLIFLIAVLSYFSVSFDGAIDILAKVVPNEVTILIKDYVRALMPTRSINVLSVSFFATIWAASRGVDAFIVSLNNSYEIKEGRNFLFKKLLAMIYTILVALSICLALVIPNMGMDFLLWVSKYIEITYYFIKVWYYIRWIIIISILILVLGSLYYIAPNKKIKLIEIIPGTLFATFGWIIISIGFSFFVNNFKNFTIVYGSLAAVIVLMIWLYLSAIILMLGGEINSICSLYKKIHKLTNE
ncbi:YihY/virulence factor BrkB family protein [Caminicella sporogenes]|uniref:YihY/virulence factor BrkB family protein n=1 Tax=Caminicella sporogenes TaxID=166485 RepID=UPI00253F877D|nr:YihY/virulence factor BrkB family protein [Caminicella sporogenes]WIF94165.1 YihY/virulence factor BrkB family protein [Caminicella sporogenes]